MKSFTKEYKQVVFVEDILKKYYFQILKSFHKKDLGFKNMKIDVLYP